MTFLLAAALMCASGVGLLRALRLGTGRLVVDVPLGWFVGMAWFAAATFSIQALLGVPANAPLAIAVLAFPLGAWGLLRGRRAGRAASGGSGAPGLERRWMPRPAWLFAPMAAWSIVVLAAVVLHGLSTPTHTDDGYRVRAYAPVLVAAGTWNGPARDLIAMAGPIPAVAPALAWVLGASVDPFHVNATIVLTFLALLALLVALASERGAPETGWGAAFALTSLPFLAYHATSTYSDAWLAMYLGAAFAFLVAFGQRRDTADAARALLLLLGAAMVKREGELVAFPAVVLLLAQVAWVRRAEGVRSLARLAPLCAAYGVVVAARVAAVGLPGAFPFLRAAAERTVAAGGAAATAAAAAGPVAARGPAPEPGVGTIFVEALFSDGNLGLLYWVLAVSVVLLFPRILKDGLAWSGAALGLIFAETAASALWLYPEFTLDHGTVHRSLLPVSAAAAVWLSALMVASCRPGSAKPIPPGRRGDAARSGSKGRPRRRGG
jgi:hypothetical protein